MTCTKPLILALGLSVALICEGSLFAGTEDIASRSNGPYLTGDWGGLRTQLENEGVTPYVIYTSIVSGNPSGGLRQDGPRYTQDINFGLTFDLQKLAGWQGAILNINAVDRIGQTIRPAIGSIYDPVQIYGGQTLTLYNVTLEQKFWNDKGAIKVGRLSPGDDFAESPLYNYYVNNDIDGQIRAVIHDTRFATYPFASWGGRLRFDPSPECNIQTGIFQVSDRYVDRYLHGAHFAIDGSDGVQVVQQFGWTPEFNRQSGTVANGPGKIGLPGHYFIGGYWSNSDYAQFGTPVKTRISYGFYGHADQMVYRPVPGRDLGLTLFGTLAYAPQQNIAILPFQVSGGALYQGLVPDRPQDMTIFGVTYGAFSNDYANSTTPPLGGRPSSETDLELGYRVQATGFAYFQPDLQYIVSPGGTGHIPNALILAMQVGVTF